MDSGKSFQAVLRWVAVLPTAFIAALASMFPAHWFLVLLYSLKSLPSDDALVTVDGKPVPFFGIPLETMERALIAAIVPIVFVLVGTWVAPARRWTVAVVLAVCWAMFMTAVVTMALSSPSLDVEVNGTTILILALNVAGLFYALRTAYSKHGPGTLVPTNENRPEAE